MSLRGSLRHAVAGLLAAGCNSDLVLVDVHVLHVLVLLSDCGWPQWGGLLCGGRVLNQP